MRVTHLPQHVAFQVCQDLAKLVPVSKTHTTLISMHMYGLWL